MANLNPHGYIAPSAVVYHSLFNSGRHCFLDDNVLIYQNIDGGPIVFGDTVEVGRRTIIQTGQGGSLSIGSATRIGQDCQVSAYLGSIDIGAGVSVSSTCTVLSFNHGMLPGRTIRSQPITTRGGVMIGDEARLDAGVIVLDGVTIGARAHIRPRSVVTRDVPEGCVYGGIPARQIE